MKRGPDPATIFRIARLYYKDELSQDEIAAREGFSRSQVSRLVDKAREMGMVRIELVPPPEPMADEAAAARKALRLRSLTIAPAPPQAEGAALARAIAAAAADLVADAIGESRVVGLGWGRSVYAASELATPRDLPGERRFVPLVGISGDEDPSLQINTIIDRFSVKFRGRGLFVNAPAVRERGAALPRIERERIANLKESWKAVRTAIVGLGDPPSLSSNFIAELPRSSRESLCGSGAVGDILGQFFLEDGRVLPVDEGYERLAMDLPALASIDRVLCLAGGPGKARGIAAAARAGYITDLVTDEATARELSALARRAAGPGAKRRGRG